MTHHRGRACDAPCLVRQRLSRKFAITHEPTVPARGSTTTGSGNRESSIGTVPSFGRRWRAPSPRRARRNRAHRRRPPTISVRVGAFSHAQPQRGRTIGAFDASQRGEYRREIGDYRKIWAETAQPRTVSGHAGAGGPCAASPRPDHRASPTARSGPPWRGADLELHKRRRPGRLPQPGAS